MFYAALCHVSCETLLMNLTSEVDRDLRLICSCVGKTCTCIGTKVRASVCVSWNTNRGNTNAILRAVNNWELLYHQMALIRCFLLGL